MKYKIDCDVFATYPELLEYEEFGFEFSAEEKAFDKQRAFVYVALAYDPESKLFKIEDQQERRERAYKQSGLPAMMRGEVIGNKNSRINAMVRRYFVLLNRPEIELYLSGQEAIHTLLEEVRRPITEDLQDDKRTTALKSKRMCFEDAMTIMGKVKDLAMQLESKRVDLNELRAKKVEEKIDDWADKSYVERQVLGRK
jgi:hypothetical protein